METHRKDTVAGKAKPPEILAFRGRLYRDLRFELQRSYSTFFVRRQPKTEDRMYLIELRNAQDKTLNRAFVQVTPLLQAGPGVPPYDNVSGYLALKEGAAQLLFFKDDLLIERLKIPAVPSLKLAWKHKSVARDGHYPLALTYSQPNDGAFVQLVYQWHKGKCQTLGFYPPAEEIDIAFRDLPGGDQCRLLVVYSNGLRAVSAATDFFSVPLKGPELEILYPLEEATFASWVPVELAGQIIDGETGPAHPQDYVWSLDGKEVLCGPTGSLEQLTEGSHRITLEYRHEGRAGKPLATGRTILVERPAERTGIPGEEWDV